MNPFSAIYGSLTYFRNLVYDSGFLSAHLEAPVVSVGSLSAGGAGKTPFVLALGELLKAHGTAFDVLSRGYGRSSKGVYVVDSHGSAREFGDEPLLIARQLGVPVIVGENRYHAGLLAEQRFGPKLHLLDDGFQHRALARDFDIVLFIQNDMHDRLLPAGRLREPLASLNRADAVVLINDALLPSVELKPRGRVWRARRNTSIARTLSRPVGFCGIARPADFFRELRGLGLNPVAEVPFRDHHAYGPEDVERLAAMAREKAADGFITTEKDEINLGALAASLNPLVLAKVTIELAAPHEAISGMLESISGCRHRSS